MDHSTSPVSILEQVESGCVHDMSITDASNEEPVQCSTSDMVKTKKKRKSSSRARLSPSSSSPLLVTHSEPIHNSKTSPSDLAGEPVSSSSSIISTTTTTTSKVSRKKDGEHSGRDSVTKDGVVKPLHSISRQMSNTSTSEPVQFEIGSMTPANSTLKMNRHTSNIDITLSCPDGPDEQAQSKTMEEVPESLRSELNDTESGSLAGSCSTQSRLEDRRKKTFSQKKPWFSAINPNYKSRSQTFKKIFPMVPTNERLIVEYSCALQKDILIQGRIYFTSNYLCFYANIFTWETSVVLRWSEIVGITKEKTALVIPNAIQFTTTTKDKYFFASFTSRDKTFNIAMKIWQNCMLEEFSNSKVWQLIHESYGDELGLTTDDEDDYLCPLDDDETGMDTSPGGTTGGGTTNGPSSLSSNVSSKEGFWSRRGIKAMNRENSRGSEYNDPSQSSAETGTDPLPTLSNQTSSSSPNVPVLDGSKSTSGFSFGRRKKKKSSTLRASEQNGGLGTSHRSEGGVACNGSVPGSEVSEDFSEEDGDDDGEVPSDDMGLCSPSNRKRRERVNRNTQRLFEEWQAAQEGREMTNQVYAMDVDMLFTYLFTNSKFYADFHKSRKTSDLVQSEWEQRSGLNDKFREVSMTLSLNNAMGPKHSGVVDSQVMKNDYTVAGEIYVIHVETVNSGIPYADSFYVTSHFCLTRVSKGTSRLVVWSNIKYKKSVWGFVKSIIEKNTWQGLEEFYNELSRDLQIGAAELAAECDVPNSLGGPLGHNPVNLKPNHSTTGLPETGEPILSQGMPLPYSSIRTLQPNEALRSPKATIPELQNVSKAAVILLILLLCANCLLYYKVWFLETTLVIDPKHPGSNSQRQGPFGPSSSFPKHLDPMLFLDKDPDSRTTEQWLEILQQQEMVHQLELEKWGEMLGTATELLRKTEDSLSNIQKSIQPLTLQKVRQMLLLQRDHERPPKPAFEPPIEPKPPVQQAVVDESPQVKKPSEVQQPQPHVKSDL